MGETDKINEDMTTKNDVTKEIIQESDSESPDPNEKQDMIKIDPKEEKVFGDMNVDFKDEKMDALEKIEANESDEANISNENDEQNESDDGEDIEMNEEIEKMDDKSEYEDNEEKIEMNMESVEKTDDKIE